MSNPTQSAPSPTTEALFDRYLLPKVALTIIVAASLLGSWVSTTLVSDSGIVSAVATWAFLVALGTLVGGLLWKHLFVRPADLGTGAREYCVAMYERFDRIASLAVIVTVLAGSVVLWRYVERFGTTVEVASLAMLGLTTVGIVAWTILTDRTVESQFRSRAGLLALTFGLLTLLATAIAEVAMRGLEPAGTVVRMLHLLAFAVWIGGAVWNIFVAVPSGKERPRVDVVAAAAEQLERFRWAVRFVIPTIFLTGAYQAVDAIGLNVSVYVTSTIGLAILAKAGFIGVLFVIFKLCPMWRACSPIEGVCDLEELGSSRVETDGDVAIDD